MVIAGAQTCCSARGINLPHSWQENKDDRKAPHTSRNIAIRVAASLSKILFCPNFIERVVDKPILKWQCTDDGEAEVISARRSSEHCLEGRVYRGLYPSCRLAILNQLFDILSHTLICSAIAPFSFKLDHPYMVLIYRPSVLIRMISAKRNPEVQSVVLVSPIREITTRLPYQLIKSSPSNASNSLRFLKSPYHKTIPASYPLCGERLLAQFKFRTTGHQRTDDLIIRVHAQDTTRNARNAFPERRPVLTPSMRSAKEEDPE